MPQQAAPARGYRRVPWSPRAWGQALYLAGGIPAQLAGLLIVFALLRWPGRFDFWVGPLWVLWLLVAAVALLLVPVLTWIQRHRLRVTAGIEIPPQPRRPDWLTRDGITETLRSQAYWRQAGYHYLAGPALAAAAIAAIGVWLAGVLYAFEYAVRVGLVPGQRSAPRHGRRHEQQPAAARFRRDPGGRRADGRRRRGPAGGPVAHLGRRLARRAGRLGAARAEPRRGAAAPGGAPDRDQGPASSTPRTPSAAGWSGTCTTAPSSGSSRWR